MKSFAWAFGAVTLGLLAAPTDARACGGCFHGESPGATQSPSVVTDHRMVLAITPTMTTLWDQVEYAGDPEEFAWVLPIRGGVVIGVGSDRFIDGLDQQTAPIIRSPQQICASPSFGGGGGSSGGGCGGGFGSSDEEAPASASPSEDAGTGWQEDSGVYVSNRSVVGPYETVQVHGSDAGGIVGWLRANKYVVPEDLVPMLQKYVSEGFDFVAVKLRPSFGVRAMRPIRVSFKGAYPTLPLRMVRAGIGNQVGLKLFVIGDGRWKTANFPTLAIDPRMLTWDFDAQRSDYVMVRDREAAKLDGRAFVLESSTDVAWTLLPGGGFVPDDDGPEDTGTPDSGAPDTGGGDTKKDTATSADSIAAEATTDVATDTGASDAASDGSDDASDDVLLDALAQTDTAPADSAPAQADTAPAQSDSAVAEDTAMPAYDGGAPPSVSAQASDIEIAFGSKTFRRITRLRADIPAKYLDVDLALEADLAQSPLSPTLNVTKAVNDPCANTTPASDTTSSSGSACDCVVAEPSQPLRAGLGVLGAALGVALLRRRRR